MWQQRYFALVESIATLAALQPPPPIIITREQYEQSGLQEIHQAGRSPD